MTAPARFLLVSVRRKDAIIGLPTHFHTAMTDPNRVFIYWDNSNIFYGAQDEAVAREGSDARRRVRIDFENILRLAHADRPVAAALVAGSIPPPLRNVWDRMRNEGVEVRLFDRGATGGGEQEVPDQLLQLRMLEDTVDYNGHPGIAVTLTGDGKGFYAGSGFHRTLERMHRKGWKVEIMSWSNSCNQRMREWAQEIGAFIALDDFYESVTFLASHADEYPETEPRESSEPDLSRRPMAR